MNDHTTGRERIEALRAVPLLEVATRLGLTRGRSGSWGPCPLCGAERRRADDARGPIGMGGRGWACHRPGCEANPNGTGRRDAVGLACAVLVGRTRPTTPGEWDAVWEGVESVGLLVSPVCPTPRTPSPPAIPRDADRPHAAEARLLWSLCPPVTKDREVSAWLTHRGADPRKVAALDLARALPERAPLPTWARPWRYGWRCVVPAFGATGALVRLRARWTREARRPAPHGIKTHAGKGLLAGGCVLACPTARALLAAGITPPGARLTSPSPGPVMWSGRVVVREGEPDWLEQASTSDPDVAVVGVFSGAWTTGPGGEGLASRWHPDTSWTLDTHDDESGDRYANAIRATLRRAHP